MGDRWAGYPGGDRGAVEMSSPVIGRPWTRAEDAVVRRLYEQGAVVVAQKLTGRTVGAVHSRAKAIGVNRPRWNEAEDARLRSLWGSKTLAELAVLFKRTEWGIFQHARSLDLSGLPQGMEWMTGAQERTGYDVKTLRKILAAANVRVGESLTVEKKRRRGPRAFRRTFVDPFDVDEAIRRWQETETAASAAARRGIEPRTLRCLLEGKPGVPRRPKGKRVWRIPTDVIDRVVAERRAA